MDKGYKATDYKSTDDKSTDYKSHHAVTGPVDETLVE